MTIHTVTVTAVPNTDQDLPDDQYIDEVIFTSVCPPDENCSVWFECKECTDYDPTEQEIEDGEFTRHGTFHQNIEDDWMTDSGQCATTGSDSARDAMAEAAEDAGLGTHQIDLDYWGDGTWTAERVITPEERTRIEQAAKKLLAAQPGAAAWDDAGPYIRDYYRSEARSQEKAK